MKKQFDNSRIIILQLKQEIKAFKNSLRVADGNIVNLRKQIARMEAGGESPHVGTGAYGELKISQLPLSGGGGC